MSSERLKIENTPENSEVEADEIKPTIISLVNLDLIENENENEQSNAKFDSIGLNTIADDGSAINHIHALKKSKASLISRDFESLEEYEQQQEQEEQQHDIEQTSVIREIEASPTSSDLNIASRIPNEINNQIPFLSRQCNCSSPEIEPCAICYMQRIPCHCHESSRFFNEELSGYETYFVGLIYSFVSILIFVVVWSLHFWLCIAYAICQAIKRFFTADFDTQVGAGTLLLVLFSFIIIHAKFLGFIQSSSSRNYYQYVNEHVPGHRMVTMPGSDEMDLNSDDNILIEIKDHLCKLKPKEYIFTLILFNENMKKLYNTTTKISLPECGIKPTLIITPNPFEISNY